MALDVMLRVMTAGAPRVNNARMMVQLERLRLGWDIDYYPCRCVDVTALNMLWQEARKREPDFLIVMLDDISLDEPSVLRRLPAHNVPTVDALVPQYREGHTFWYAFHMTSEGAWFTANPYGKSGLHQVYSSAMACCCYRHDILMNDGIIDEPFWQEDLDEHGCHVRPMSTADTFLCRRLHAANIPHYVDYDVVARHVGKSEALEAMNVVRSYIRRNNRAPEDAYALPSRSYLDTRTVYEEALPMCDSYRAIPDGVKTDEGLRTSIQQVKEGKAQLETVKGHVEVSKNGAGQ